MEPNATTAYSIKGLLLSMPFALLPGAQGQALWIGMLVAFVMLFFLKSINTLSSSFAAVALSSICSGYFSQSVGNYIAIKFPELVAAPITDVSRNIASIMVGIVVPLSIVAVPKIFPVFLRYWQRKGDRR